MKIILKDFCELPWPGKIQYMICPTLNDESWKAAMIVVFISPWLVLMWGAIGVMLWPFIYHLWPTILVLVVIDAWQNRTIPAQR